MCRYYRTGGSIARLWVLDRYEASLGGRSQTDSLVLGCQRGGGDSRLHSCSREQHCFWNRHNPNDRSDLLRTSDSNCPFIYFARQDRNQLTKESLAGDHGWSYSATLRQGQSSSMVIQTVAKRANGKVSMFHILAVSRSKLLRKNFTGPSSPLEKSTCTLFHPYRNRWFELIARPY